VARDGARNAAKRGISPAGQHLPDYVLDFWVHRWRRRHTRRSVSIVRYADDFVTGTESAADAPDAGDPQGTPRKVCPDPPDKTSLIEFGRLLAVARQQRGRRGPGTFAFLRFTRYRRRTRDGRFIMKRKSKRLRKLNALHPGRVATHALTADRTASPASVLRGHCGYYVCRRLRESETPSGLSKTALSSRSLCLTIMLLHGDRRRYGYELSAVHAGVVSIVGKG
jgi:hypothetical protein